MIWKASPKLLHCIHRLYNGNGADTATARVVYRNCALAVLFSAQKVLVDGVQRPLGDVLEVWCDFSKPPADGARCEKKATHGWEEVLKEHQLEISMQARGTHSTTKGPYIFMYIHIYKQLC